MPVVRYDNATLATLADRGYGHIREGCLLTRDDRIVYAGPAAGAPDIAPDRREALDGRLITPGLVDCHTHLVYAGSRAAEFEQRLAGVSYEDIAAGGGGIAATVAATRGASEDTLFAAALARLDRLLAEGVTTVEIKSGYGLDLATELRQLRVARRLETVRPVRVVTTFLGAHAVPAGELAETYLEDTCLPALRAAAEAGLVDMVDAFCEPFAFTVRQVERVFEVAAELGLPVKLHAEQLSNQGGARLAAGFGARSVDHLEYLAAGDIAALASAGTVAVLLPAAFYTLRETRRPPIDGLRAAGVPMAVATDSNPGSAPTTSILLAMNLAATLFGLSPAECLAAVTRNACRALGIEDAGQLAAGQRADLAIWDTDDPAELAYRMGDAPLHARVFGGVPC